jgi:hypothetical protein
MQPHICILQCLGLELTRSIPMQPSLQIPSRGNGISILNNCSCKESWETKLRATNGQGASLRSASGSAGFLDKMNFYEWKRASAANKNLIKVQTDIKVEISSMRSNRSAARANSEWCAVLYCAVRNTVGTRFYTPDPPRLRAINQSGLTVEPES